MINFYNRQKVETFLRLISEYSCPKGTWWLAGGAARSILTNEPVSDFDIFFRDEYNAKNAEKRILFYAEKIFECPKGELRTFRFTREGNVPECLRGCKVQFITKRYYTDIHDLLDSFDFTVCRFGIDLCKASTQAVDVSGEVVCETLDLEDAYNKVLRIHNLEYPVATLNRIQKYMRKGFRPYLPNEFWRGIVDTIASSEWDDEHMQLYID